MRKARENKVSASLFEALGKIHHQEGLEELLDFTCHRIAAATDWSTALLTFYLADDAFHGAAGCPPGTKKRFRESFRNTKPERREQKRRSLVELLRPGTNICFLPAGCGPRPSGAFRPSRPAKGTWQPQDRLIILLRDWTDAIIGTLSLDNPVSGNRPDAAEFERLVEVDRFVGIVGKIAENRYLALLLREGEAAYRSIFRSASDALIILEPSGVIVKANPAAGRMLGYPPEKIVGRSSETFVDPSQRQRLLDAAQETGSKPSYAAEYRFLGADGSVLDVEVRMSSLTYRGRSRILALVRDISQRKANLDRFLEQQKEESIVAVAGGVAHETNNILMGITGSLSLLERSLPLRSDAWRHCERIGDSAAKLSRLAGQLLAVSRGAQSALRPFSLSGAVEETADRIRSMARPNVRIELDTGSGEDLWGIEGDRVQLAQMVLNLAENACEAMEDGGRLRIATSNARMRESWTDFRGETWRAGDYVRLRVEDRGPGMDEETLSRLFDPYFSTKSTGRGLGLTVVLGIVRRHGGAISIDSRVGDGTAVEILLPRFRGARIPAARTPPAEASRVPAPTVLLVEDEEDVREVTQEMLQTLGWRVVAAENAERALDVYRESGADFQLSLIDVELPGMSGFDLSKEIARWDDDARIILTSGHTEALVRESLHPGGRVLGFLQKPYTLLDLEARIEEVAATPA